MSTGSRYLQLVILVFITSTADADIFGEVVAVTDGDTIKVLDGGNVQHKIRLSGIDAPERAQPFGNASRKHLASLVAGKDVRVETLKKDRFGRMLGKVWVQPPDCPNCGWTQNANLAQIQSGMAWWYRDYAKDQSMEDREHYKSAAQKAREEGLGLWSEAGPIPPWAWRRGQRNPAGTEALADSQCGNKFYCRDMSSCEEAKFYLQQCGRSPLDGDRDGVPCESICR